MNNEKSKTFIYRDIPFYDIGSQKPFLAKVEVNIHLQRSSNNQLCFSATADVYNQKNNDAIFGGQCFNTIKKHSQLYDIDDIFRRIYDLWSQYHLNDMHAGTERQEQCIYDGIKNGKLKSNYDYKDACQYLESKDLLVDKEYTKLNKDGYRYGTSWLYRELPNDVLADIDDLLSISYDEPVIKLVKNSDING